jgi:hypothetical protein
MRGLLDTASRSLRYLAQQARKHADFSDAQVIETIGCNVANADATKYAFGLAVSDLLTKFGAPRRRGN